jgi:hypothetical protein
MLTSLELRWFCHGVIPEKINHWFQQGFSGEELGFPEQRQDQYLSTAGCEHLGIKLRQSQLEIKWRQQQLGTVHFLNGSEGQVEQWIKWTCLDPATNTLLTAEGRLEGPWISVLKIRSQRKYKVSTEQSFVEVPVNESIDQGCTLELTELSVKDKSWWSLSFEAFGANSSLKDNLQLVANQVIQSYPGTALQSQDSYAYPKWLSLLAD